MPNSHTPTPPLSHTAKPKAKPPTLLRSYALTLLLAVLLLTGCEESVDPIVEGGPAFSIYGFLDTAADTQFVRVEAVQRLLQERDSSALDARVTLEEVATGRSVVLQDSIIRFRDRNTGARSWGHVFFAPYEVLPDAQYRLAVERSDGERAAVTVATPPQSVVDVQDVVSNTGSSALQVSQRIFFRDVPRVPDTTDVVWRFFVAASPPFEYRYPAQEASLNASGDWELFFDMDRSFRFLAEVEVDTVDGVPVPLIERHSRFLDLQASVTFRNDDWARLIDELGYTPPLLTEELAELAQPNRFSNVEGGYGFVGAVTRQTVTWQLPPEVVRSFGFRPYGEG